MNVAVRELQLLSTSVLAGVITHNPDTEQLRWLITRLAVNGCRILVIDNDSDNKLDIEEVVQNHLTAELIAVGSNLGVAGALNLLIHEAERRGVNYIIPFDQDSRPAEDAIEILFQAFCALEVSNKVAAIGMCVVDGYTGRSIGFTSFSFPFNRRYPRPINDEATVSADFLITSGCMMSLDAIKDIGGMEDALFIDSIDLEWSFRARAKGWDLLGCFAATMVQTIGREPLKLPFFKLTVKNHNPHRYYYMTRNRLVLYKRSYSNKAWVIKDSVRAVLKLMVMLVVRKDRLSVLKYHYLALREGFPAGEGKLNQ